MLLATRLKISKSCKERGVGKWMIGRIRSYPLRQGVPLTPEQKKKMSESHKKRWDILGRKPKRLCCDCNSIVKNYKAKRCGVCVRKFMSGSNSPHWKGGIYPVNMSIRRSLKYKKWAKQVKERDNYTCVICNDKTRIGHKVILHSDHIKPFAYFPELRFELSNGRTLCFKCHSKTDNFGINVGRERKHKITEMSEEEQCELMEQRHEIKNNTTK